MLALLWTTAALVQPLRMAAQQRSRGGGAQIAMKGLGHRRFSLDMWYGDIGKKNTDWVSPWAHAHLKLRQQEIEIGQCEFLLKDAIEKEDYDQADGLRARIDLMRSKHPLLWREERLQEAIADENYGLAAAFQKDLDAVRVNLGLPKYDIGQTIVHPLRGIRGVIMDVDLVCRQTRDWILGVGCLERALLLDCPPDECNVDQLQKWRRQPFYTILPDLRDLEDRVVPLELNAWVTDPRVDKTPPALYLAEEMVVHHALDEAVDHPDVSQLFEPEPQVTDHRGREYLPKPRLRLWQQERERDRQFRERKERYDAIGVSTNSNGDTGWNYP